MLAVLVFGILSEQISRQSEKGLWRKNYLNCKERYAPFRNIDFIILLDKISGKLITKSVELTEKTKDVLEKLDCLMSFQVNENKGLAEGVVSKTYPAIV